MWIVFHQWKPLGSVVQSRNAYDINILIGLDFEKKKKK